MIWLSIGKSRKSSIANYAFFARDWAKLFLYFQREFWSKGENSFKQYVLIQRTYSFPYSLPEHLMSLILSAVTTYGRLIMMSAEGAVVQMGATQTVIVQHTGLYGTVACFMWIWLLYQIFVWCFVLESYCSSKCLYLWNWRITQIIYFSLGAICPCSSISLLILSHLVPFQVACKTLQLKNDHFVHLCFPTVLAESSHIFT